MTKVKICGITNLEDAKLAVEFGADMLGFNFYERSKRFISPEEVDLLVDKLNSQIRKVGVFVNPTIDDILFARTLANLDAIQLHGDETPKFISELKENVDTEVIRAIRVVSGSSIDDVTGFGADAILLDTFSTNEYGGTGKVFDWQMANSAVLQRDQMYLAGGLNPENVASAIQAIRPYAVDVASGVESSPGKKDPKKLEAFIKNAKNA